MALSAYERETVVNASEGDDAVTILTHHAPWIRRLRAHPRVTEIRSGVDYGTEWAEFTIAARDWSPLHGITRRRELTEEQRAELAEAMRVARAGGPRIPRRDQGHKQSESTP